MYSESSSSRAKTGGPDEFIHPEYVYGMGKRFLSSWGEENLRLRLQIFEDTLKDMASGRVAPADLEDVALRALREAERRVRPLA